MGTPLWYPMSFASRPLRASRGWCCSLVQGYDLSKAAKKFNPYEYICLIGFFPWLSCDCPVGEAGIYFRGKDERRAKNRNVDEKPHSSSIGGGWGGDRYLDTILAFAQGTRRSQGFLFPSLGE